MILLPVALLYALMQPSASPKEHWVGSLVIGAVVYAVSAEVTAEGHGMTRFSLQVSPRGDGLSRSVVATLGQSHSEIAIDGGKPRRLAPEVASTWQRQLVAGLGSAVAADEFECRLAGKTKICDSRALIRLDDSLSGRLRITYNERRVISIRFFSLAEWTNPFGEYVSLSLDIQ